MRVSRTPISSVVFIDLYTVEFNPICDTTQKSFTWSFPLNRGRWNYLMTCKDSKHGGSFAYRFGDPTTWALLGRSTKQKNRGSDHPFCFACIIVSVLLRRGGTVV